MLFSEIKDKEVVCLSDGTRYGLIDDVEFDTKTAQISRFYIYGRTELFGIGGHSDSVVIELSDVDTIGGDIILVKKVTETSANPKKKGFFNL